jgi:hypothetical protein
VRPRPPRHRRPDPEPYQQYRQPLQRKWRPLIIARDAGRCRACGERPRDAALLDMAHITDCVAFVRAAADHRAVTFSFRWDNLYMLCRACHRASHRHRFRAAESERRTVVERIEAEMRKVRGWSSPFAVLPPALVPERLKHVNRFHDRIRISPLVPFPTFGRYAADGGIVFADEELGPQQTRLVAADEGGPADASARAGPQRAGAASDSRPASRSPPAPA